MCAGSHLANRELYTAFIRLITAFEFSESEEVGKRAVLDCIEANAIPTSLTMEPKRFRVAVKVRDPRALERWIGESEERTKDL